VHHLIVVITLRRYVYIVFSTSAGLQSFTHEDFKKFYPKFVDCLPMNDPKFLADLYSQDFLSGDMKNKIESMDTQPAKASYFLDQVIKPSLTMTENNLFEKLVKLIEDSDSEVLKDLSRKLKKMLESQHSEEGM